ncbi:MAG: hypothetical protein COB49_01235 [Alphaproteobacteria bacterium]|nr:MAG: hypothetical protein COB49_01235 [Alphaproteobacteria bacterium]
MTLIAPSRPRKITFAAIVAGLFGVLTLYSGGTILFIDGPARVAAGAYVPFVLWFNFFAGAAYILAGTGLYLWQKWAVNLSLLIAVATLLVFASFGIHVMTGGAYEPRTIGAMSLRSIVWLAIAYFVRTKKNRSDIP